MSLKNYLGIGIVIFFLVISFVFGYKVWQGLTSEAVAIGIKITFVAGLVVVILAIGVSVGVGLHYLALKSATAITQSTIDMAHRNQELTTDITKKALDTTIAVAGSKQTVNLLTSGQQQNNATSKVDDVIDLKQWEKG